MLVTQSGEAVEIDRGNTLVEALKFLESEVSPRFLRTFILIRVHGVTWRERARELRVRPGAIGYQIRAVQRAIDRFVSNEQTAVDN